MYASALLAVLLIPLIGAATLALLPPPSRPWNRLARCGLSWGLGIVVSTQVLFFASLAGMRPHWLTGVVTFIALALAAFTRKQGIHAWWGSGSSAQPRSQSGSHVSIILDLALGTIVVVTLFVVGTVCLLEPLVEWDVLAIWAFKAKILAAEPASATEYFYDISKAYSHPDYPLLWPLAIAWVWSVVGSPDILVIKVLGAFMLGAYALTFYGLLIRRCNRTRLWRIGWAH